MLIIYTLYTCYIHINILENLSIGYSPVWRQLWAYNIHKIIGRGQSWRPIISRLKSDQYIIPWPVCTFDITVVK